MKSPHLLPLKRAFSRQHSSPSVGPQLWLVYWRRLPGPIPPDGWTETIGEGLVWIVELPRRSIDSYGVPVVLE